MGKYGFESEVLKAKKFPLIPFPVTAVSKLLFPKNIVPVKFRVFLKLCNDVIAGGSISFSADVANNCLERRGECVDYGIFRRPIFMFS